MMGKSEDDLTCGAVHPDDDRIVCTRYEHTSDHHRGWCEDGHPPMPVHWGADAGRLARTRCWPKDDQ